MSAAPPVQDQIIEGASAATSPSAASTSHDDDARGFASSSSSSPAPININTISEKLKHAEYAVRGAIVQRAQEIEDDLRKGVKKPFDKVIYCNIGNPQQLGQQPLTFGRQVSALLESPYLIDMAKSGKLPAGVFASDAVERAAYLMSEISGGVGAYSDSRGVRAIRESVVRFIQNRDGYPADVNSIYLSDGATPAISRVIQMLIRDENDAIMIPVPTYPLYTATVTLMGGYELFYYLDEEHDWGLNVASQIEELEQRVAAAKQIGKRPRALTVINPGNPAGNVLDEAHMRDIVRFCSRHGIAILADEVYQENVHIDSAKFISFKKVVCDMEKEGEVRGVQLFSFHSTSKGFTGECGKRGGYVETYNVPEDVKNEMYKHCSLNLCPNLCGQVAVEVMVNPPAAGSPSHAQYVEERDAIKASLRRKAHMLQDGFNQMEGVTCNFSSGALYSFPQIRLPAAAVEAAKKAGKPADALYCLQLLEETGICVVPGSGFQQKPGTFHFRTTLLPQEADMPAVIDRMKAFHARYLAKFK